MRNEAISIEPQMIQFNEEHTQRIKVINNTDTTLTKLFFCLYNVQKFEFKPDTFTLSPKQHQLINITLKIDYSKYSISYKDVMNTNQKEGIDKKRIDQNVINYIKSPIKQYAYLKSSQINKRLTIIIKNKIQPPKIQKQVDIINTYTQRQYNKIQHQALQKILQEKQNYIKYLQTTFKNKQQIQSNKEFHQLKYQNDRIKMENVQLRQKIKQIKLLSHKDLSNYQEINSLLEEKNKQIQLLTHQNMQLQDKYNQTLTQLARNQHLTNQFQQLKHKLIEEAENNNKEIVIAYEEQLQKQKEIYQKSIKQEYNEIARIKNQNQQNYETILNQKSQQIQHLGVIIEKQIKQIQYNHQIIKKYQQRKIQSQQRQQHLKQKLIKIEKQIQFQKNKQQFIIKPQREIIILEQSNKYLQSEINQLKNDKKINDNKIKQLIEINKNKDNIIQCLREEKQKLQLSYQEFRQNNQYHILQLKAQNVRILEQLSIKHSNREQGYKFDWQNKIAKEAIEIKQTNRSLNHQIQDLSIQLEEWKEKLKKIKRQNKKEIKLTNEELQKAHKDNADLQEKLRKVQEQSAKRQWNHENGIKHYKDEYSQDKYKWQEGEINTKYHRPRGIINQRNQLNRQSMNQQRGNKEDIYTKIADLQQLQSYIVSEAKRFRILHNLQQALEGGSMTIAIRLFKAIDKKLNENGQITNLRRKVIQLQSTIKQNSYGKHQNIPLQYIKQEMKSQYIKLYEALQLSKNSFQFLKQKIYQQYRSKIIQLVSSKDHQIVLKLQQLLSRFVEYMGNISHKNAILAKEVKLKNKAKKQANTLKHQIYDLTSGIKHINDKTKIPRNSLKILKNDSIQWQQNLKLQAQFLTQQAQILKLKEQLDYSKLCVEDKDNKIATLEEMVQKYQETITNLKKDAIDIKLHYDREIDSQNKMIKECKDNINKKEDNSKKTNIKATKEYQKIQQELDRKNVLLKNSQERQKKLEQEIRNQQELLLHANERQVYDRQNQMKRMQQSLKQVSKHNRELRQGNEELKAINNGLRKNIQLKKAQINNLKGINREQQLEIEISLLKQEKNSLKEQLRMIKESYEKYRKMKQNQIDNLESIQLQRNNQEIVIKSLESIIRCLLQNIRKAYWNIRQVNKKKGIDTIDKSYLLECPDKIININALRIFQVWEIEMKLLQNYIDNL